MKAPESVSDRGLWRWPRIAPFRRGIVYHEIDKILKKQAEMNFIDKRIAYLLILNYAEVYKTIKEHQDATREFYE